MEFENARNGIGKLFTCQIIEIVIGLLGILIAVLAALFVGSATAVEAGADEATVAAVGAGIGTLFAVVMACVIGLLLSLVLKRRGEDRAFPFGPSIALATAVMLLYGAPLIGWYQRLIM